MTQIYQKATGWATTKWITFDVATLRDTLPRVPACYVVYLDGVLSYIGQSVDFGKRISMHGIRLTYGASIATKWGCFKSVVIKARFADRTGDWAMREIRLIKRLQPPLNCAGSTRKRAQA